MRVLLIRYSSLGDIVLAGAVPRAIHAAMPDADITFLTKQSYLPLVEHFVTEVTAVAVPDNHALGASVRVLRSRRFDVIIDLHATFRSVIVSHALYAKQRVRVAKETRRRQQMVKHKRGLDHPISVVANYCAAARRAFPSVQEHEPGLRLDPDEETAARELRTQLPHALGIGWGARWPTKAAPTELWVAAMTELAQRGISSVRLFGLPRDKDGMGQFASRLRADLPNIQVAVHAGLMIPELMVHLASCSAYAGSDSGLTHIAAALGIPSVAVFGPTHPSLGFALSGNHTRTIHSDVWCSPCHKHGAAPCFRDRRYCFEEIDPKTISTAIHDLSRLNRSTI